MTQLSKNDCKSICLALDSENQMKFEIIDDIPVYRIKDRVVHRIFAKSAQTLKCYSFLRKIAIIYSRVTAALYAICWPLLSISVLMKFYITGARLIKREKVEVVVAVYKGFESLLSGLLLKIRYPRIIFVCYNLDCMSKSLVPRIRNTNIALNSVKRWERIIFSKADYVCIMKSHEKHYGQGEYGNYFRKFIVMDIPLLELRDNNINHVQKERRHRISLVFTGSMIDSTANPIYFLQLLEMIVNIEFEFHIYGRSYSDLISNSIRESGLYGSRIFWHGVVPPNVAIEKQREADILISFGNDNECMIPSKIFQYISLKKPIIHLYRSSSDASLPYLTKYSNATLIQERRDLEKRNLETLSILLTQPSSIEIQDGELISKFYDNTPAPMANFLSCI